MRRRAAGAALVLACSLATAGCADDQDQQLTVLAASSLTDVYAELATEFEEQHDAEVTFSFGSSTDLAEQAADGAPGDVLTTADEAAMQIAQEAEAAGAATTLATNVLTIVTPPDNPAGIEGLDDLEGTTWVRCADDVPCGRVALDVLESAGITAEPASLEEDVRATLDKVVAGEADAGLVYASDAVAAGDDVQEVPIPDAEVRRTSYLQAVLEGSSEPELARAWEEFVLSEEARAILEEAGFSVPPTVP